MNKFNPPSFRDPGLEGPDYVALVIEWDEPVMSDRLEDEVTIETKPVHVPMRNPLTPFVKSIGAIAALGFAVWGLRRLSAA